MGKEERTYKFVLPPELGIPDREFKVSDLIQIVPDDGTGTDELTIEIIKCRTMEYIPFSITKKEQTIIFEPVHEKMVIKTPVIPVRLNSEEGEEIGAAHLQPGDEPNKMQVRVILDFDPIKDPETEELVHFELLPWYAAPAADNYYQVVVAKVTKKYIPQPPPVPESKLSKKDFWDVWYAKYPGEVQRFYTWLDDYQKRVGWDGLIYDDYKEGDRGDTPAYFDLPIAMQVGIFIQFVAETDNRYGIEMIIEYKEDWAAVPQTIHDFFFHEYDDAVNDHNQGKYMDEHPEQDYEDYDDDEYGYDGIY